MKLAAALLVAFVSVCALASEPGQPLDCSDWVIVKPGISCSVSIPGNCQHDPLCRRGSNIAVGADGCRIYLRTRLIFSCPPILRSVGRTELVEVCGGTRSVVAYVDDRCGEPIDMTYGPNSETTNPPGETDDPDYKARLHDTVTMDPTTGILFVSLANECAANGVSCLYNSFVWLAQFSGFTTTFEVLQGYQPQPAQLAFRVPYMPEGMAGADHFDTYWGTLTPPIDFTQAHGLQCGYPPAQPHAGDYMSVPDTLPTPSPGTGYYYVTSTTYQGQTRYGRKTTAGRQSGRDPALLPACSQ